ncbi:VOC family protein [Mangrovicoccus sp. HB161399]|uniref:VOC family protein n=1 Tax=Mangrovicoccus sp. HB161399 TaxID=2720392 RepID=UPI00155791E6|nr:VOC family protein [Mangrovicoccus sp. HB161399]
MSFMPANFNVWAEIPVRNLDAAIAFYRAATGGTLSLMEMGGERVAAFATDGRGVSANLFEGEPGRAEAGPVIFLSAQGSIEEAASRAEAAGGRVLGAPVTIPPGRYVYVADPDGNRIGLFEAAA